MKKFWLLFFILLASVSVSYSQFSFGVSPGLGFNEAYFGLKMGAFVPFVGVQYLSGSVSSTEKGMEYDYETDRYIPYTDEYESSLGLIMPFIGAKYFFEDSKDIRSYASAIIYKPIAFGSSKRNGRTDEDFEDAVSSIDIWSFQLGYGVEYYFSKSFSLGGEFGFRLFTASESDKTTDTYYDPDINDYVSYDRTYDYDLGLNLIYTKFTFNFYFH